LACTALRGPGGGIGDTIADTGFAATSLEHADFGTAALHSALNLSGFANQMHI